MRIPRAALEEMCLHARTGYPFEVCGVLLGQEDRVETALAVQNREAEKPRTRYAIAPVDLLRIQREARDKGLEIIGYYHSHPDHPARPSETDRQIAAQGLSDGVLHVVVGVDGGTRATPTAWVFRDETASFEAQDLVAH